MATVNGSVPHESYFKSNHTSFTMNKLILKKLKKKYRVKV